MSVAQPPQLSLRSVLHLVIPSHRLSSPTETMASLAAIFTHFVIRYVLTSVQNYPLLLFAKVIQPNCVLYLWSAPHLAPPAR